MGKETRRKTDTEESLLDSSLSNYDDNNAVSKFIELKFNESMWRRILVCIWYS